MQLPFATSRSIEIRIMLRSVVLWLLVRLNAGVFTNLAGANPLRLTFPAALLVIIVSAILSYLELRRNNEHLMLLNLGTSRVITIVMTAWPPLFLEILVALSV